MSQMNESDPAFRVRDSSEKPGAASARLREWPDGESSSRNAHASTALGMTTQLRFKYAPNPCNPPSRPYPLSLYPPKGEVGSNLL